MDTYTPRIAEASTTDILVLTAETEITALKAEWDELWHTAAGTRLSQSFDWCLLSWQVRAWTRNAELFIVVVRRGGKLIMVLPLVREHRKFIRVLIPLGPGGTEFSLSLCAAGEDEDALLDQVVDYFRRTRVASSWYLPYVPASSGLGRLLGRAPNVNMQGEIFASWVDWTGVTDWEQFLMLHTGSGLVKNYRRLRRKIQNEGDLSFVCLSEQAEQEEALNWVFEKKLQWLLNNQIEGSHLVHENYKHFFMEMARSRFSCANLEIYCLKLGEKIVSAALVAPGNALMEILIITYDADYAKYSVGRLLMEDLMFKAYSAHLPVDMRIGDDQWKMSWITHKSRAVFGDIVLDRMGQVYTFVRKVKTALKYRTKALSTTTGQVASVPAEDRP